MTTQLRLGVGPYSADIGDGLETFSSLAEVQRAVHTRISGARSSSDWYARCRSSHGPKITDATGKVVATVSYNSRLWQPRGAREEIVLPSDSQ